MGKKNKAKSHSKSKSLAPNTSGYCHRSRNKSILRATSSRYDDDDDIAEELSVNQDTTESDIPGYYFDTEKKAYFKILPNHLGCGGSFVTKESIKKNKNEIKIPQIKRHSTNSCFKFMSSIYSGARRSKDIIGHSITQSLYSTQIGQVPCQLLKNHVMYEKYKNIDLERSWTASEVILPNFGVHLEALQRMELNSKRDKAVCVWSVEMDMSQKIQLMSISYNGKRKSSSEEKESFPVKIQPSKSYGVTCSSKISSLCWSPLSSYPGKSCVLYTTVFPLGDFNSKVSISNLQAKEREMVNIFDFSLGRGTVWSSSWNRVNSRFSVGCERKCQVVDVHARRQWVYSTGNSDVLAQLFSVENPHLLFNGTRSGHILIHDLRTSGTNHVPMRLNQKTPVVCIRSSSDENYLYASDFSGLICLWDRRFEKIVMKYSQLVNSHYQLPFYLDETERYIYGTGSDGYCKLWDQATGDVITTIPPPISDVRSDCMPMFPISHFSAQWTGRKGLIGAITGMGRKFFVSH